MYYGEEFDWTQTKFILADNIFCPCQSEENMNLNVHCKCLAVSEGDVKDNESIPNFDININHSKADGDLSQTLMKTLESSNQEHWTRSFTECVLNSANNQSSHRKQDWFFFK